MLEMYLNVEQKSSPIWETTQCLKQALKQLAAGRSQVFTEKERDCITRRHSLLHFQLSMFYSLTANETPTGLRIHFGGFFNGGIKVV